ncbi:MAG TPA: ABC transporter substrate-binding protein [Methylomirabilota bacterium]|nr:ABC transporter substrate-binding protein [Methylomirabilota bacterium]
MRRATRRIAVSLALAAILAGCARSEESSRQTSGPVTVIFKHGKIAGDPALFSSLLRRFEAEHPGIRVRDEILPASTDQQHQFYVISLEGRSSEFDVLSMDVIWVQEFARAGWIRDLSHLLPPHEREEFFSAPIAAVTYEGRAYAVPWYVDAGLLYYRKDLLDRYGFRPPTTWQELVTAAQTILKKENDPGLRGFVWQGKQYEGLICNALEYVWSAGGDVLGEDGRVVLASRQASMALDFMRELIDQQVSPAMVTSADEEATRRLFGEGRAIFLRNWPYAWNLFEREGSPVRGKVGVAQLPSFPGYPPAATLGGWQLGVNRYSRHPKAAEALINFLTSPEIQRWMAVKIGYKPSRKALYRDPELLRAQPFIASLYEIFLLARPRPVSPYYLMLSQVMQPEFSAALVGVKSAEQALSDAERQMSRILFGKGAR